MAHTNVFIPSTIHGSNFHRDDDEQLEKNLETAADVYISRCNGASFQESQIMLLKGSKDDMGKKLQERQPHLETFLKGSRRDKQELKKSNPVLYEHFEDVWNPRERHMVKGLPSNYLFQLLPCYEEDCPHRVCSAGKPDKELCWYEGAPPPCPIYQYPFQM